MHASHIALTVPIISSRESVTLWFLIHRLNYIIYNNRVECCELKFNGTNNDNAYLHTAMTIIFLKIQKNIFKMAEKNFLNPIFFFITRFLV